VISWKYDRSVRNGMPPHDTRAFNDAQREHPRYPIAINFYEDRESADFEKLRGLFKPA